MTSCPKPDVRGRWPQVVLCIYVKCQFSPNMANSTDVDAGTLLCYTSHISTLLETMCKSQGITPATKSLYVTLHPSDGPSEKIDVAVMGTGSTVESQLNLIRGNLHKEISMAYFILDENLTITRTIEKRIDSQVVWQDRPYENNYPSSCELKLKARIVWYLYELNRCQLRILELAKQSDKIQFEPDGLVTIAPTSVIKRSAAYSSPLFKEPVLDETPFPRKPKPCNITFEIFINLRNFVFNEMNTYPYGTKLRLADRIELMNSLDEYQVDELLSAPQDFFVKVVQWLGMSAEEFIIACFINYVKESPSLHTFVHIICPCGRKLQCVHRSHNWDVSDIRHHESECEFSRFVCQRCPDILQQNLYRLNPSRKMGVKETAYIVDVIKKRLPKNEWKNTCIHGSKLENEEIAQGN